MGETINQQPEDSSVVGTNFGIEWVTASGLTKKVSWDNVVGLSRAGGSAWAWTAWTPTLTNLTLGNGTVTALYARIGNIIVARISFIMGTTSAVSGSPTFSLPVTAAAYAGTNTTQQVGVGRYLDNSAGNTYPSAPTMQSTTTIRMLHYSGSPLGYASTSATQPFTWATNDEIHIDFFYEPA